MVTRPENKEFERITLHGVEYEVYHSSEYPRDTTSDKCFMYADTRQRMLGKRLHVKRFPERVVWLVES
jgi:hypothetical protein